MTTLYEYAMGSSTNEGIEGLRDRTEEDGHITFQEVSNRIGECVHYEWDGQFAEYMEDQMTPEAIQEIVGAINAKISRIAAEREGREIARSVAEAIEKAPAKARSL
jgi:hypothetical protein